MKGPRKETGSDTKLRSYQKATLFLFYPFLLSFMSDVIGSFGEGYDYALSFGFDRWLLLFLREKELLGSEPLSIFFGCFLSFLLLLASIFLSLKAARGKKYPIVVVFVYFAMNLLLVSFGVLSFFPFPMGLTTYILSLVIHAIFLSLCSLLWFKYDRLNSILKEEAQEKSK